MIVRRLTPVLRIAGAALLAAPAPIAARLLGADMPLLDQRDAGSFLHAASRGGQACHAGAQDEDVEVIAAVALRHRVTGQVG